jgi:pimeloyl-ACP methyl ester carboxylesterase
MVEKGKNLLTNQQKNSNKDVPQKRRIKMRFNKTMSIFAILVMVIAVGTPSGLLGNNYNNGHDVDAIYQSIRNAGPLYEWDQDIVEFYNEGMKIVCTLVIPNTGKKPPVVITLNGFAEDRYYFQIPNTGGEYFYDRLSRILAEQGFATLRVDYRGSGESDGDYSFTTLSTQISDALAAVEYLTQNQQNVVNTHSIGMVGHSQGGLVASVAASRDERVDSVVVWSAPNSPFCYESVFARDFIKQGLALPDGGSITVELVIGGEFYGYIDLGKGFFQDLFKIDPVAAIASYKRPLMYIAGKYDTIVWPQPAVGEMFLKYHKGIEKLVALDGDHEFNSWCGPELFDDTLYWTAAWFIKTLKDKH